MHIQASARGAACPGGGLEEQEVGQAGAEQVLHLPLELDPPLAAGELVGLRDKWSAGKGGKSRRTGENWLPLSFKVSMMSPRPTPLDKFAETGWRWLFYFTAHVVR